jgi:hypothetical protein
MAGKPRKTSLGPQLADVRHSGKNGVWGPSWLDATSHPPQRMHSFAPDDTRDARVGDLGRMRQKTWMNDSPRRCALRAARESGADATEPPSMQGGKGTFALPRGRRGNILRLRAGRCSLAVDDEQHAGARNRVGYGKKIAN